MNMDGNEVVLSVLGLIEMVWCLKKGGIKVVKVVKKKDKKKSEKIKIDQNWDKIEVILYIIIKISN
jgi:hypothetical protein